MTQNRENTSLPTGAGDQRASRRLPAGRLFRRIVDAIPTLAAVAALAALLIGSQAIGWKLPKFSALLGNEQAQESDWCEAHNVPDSICVECRKDCMPPEKQYGWCRQHGVADCPLCHPDVAQLPSPPVVTSADLEQARRALKESPRVTNNPKCALHERRIQIASGDAVAKLGLEVAEVRRGPVADAIMANGEIGFDQTRVARLSPRVAGVVLRVEKQQGDRVRAGDVLAVVDAVEVGKAKAEYLQALAQSSLKSRALAALKASPATVAGSDIAQAEAAAEESRIALINAEQTLANLDLPVRTESLKSLPADEIAQQIRFLGLPAEMLSSIDPATASGNLIPIRAPIDGTIVARDSSAGQTADPAHVLFTVADTRHMWLTLDLRLEDIGRLDVGNTVRFTLDSGGEVEGKLAWLSTAADERTRTVKVRAELSNESGRLLAHAFGMGRIELRRDDRAIVVPSEAVHWEGDCHVVFVRDKDFDRDGSPKVFHVRKVQPGVSNGATTEIIAGVLPGELVATTGSGTLRAELLRANLGAG